MRLPIPGVPPREKREIAFAVGIESQPEPCGAWRLVASPLRPAAEPPTSEPFVPIREQPAAYAATDAAKPIKAAHGASTEGTGVLKQALRAEVSLVSPARESLQPATRKPKGVSTTFLQIARHVAKHPLTAFTLRSAVELSGYNQYRVAAYLKSHRRAKLQLGSGGHALAGWMNTDILPLRANAIYLDATRRFPLPDDTFDYVHSEHLIEHVSYEGGITMLAEVLRVLRPGGQLRLSTPDMQFLVDLLKPRLSPLQRAYVDWAGKKFLGSEVPVTPIAVINNFLRAWGHTCIYDRSGMIDLMSYIGFVDIREFDVNQSDDPVLAGIDNDGRMPAGFLALESMIFQARKPG